MDRARVVVEQLAEGVCVACPNASAKGMLHVPTCPLQLPSSVASCRA
jgi:hypothetical protein